MTTVVTPTIGKIEDIFKDLVYDNLVELALLELFSVAPWLNVWPISGAVKYIFRLFANKLFALIRMNVDLALIRLINFEHQRAFDQEMVKLKIIAIDYGVDSPEFAKEKENAKKAFAALVSYSR